MANAASIVNFGGSGRHRCARLADHLPNQIPAMASRRTICLMGKPFSRQGQDGRIGLLAAQIASYWRRSALVSSAGIDRGRADDASRICAHRFAHSVEKGPAGVLHQMPAIGDLHRVRARPWLPLRHSPAAITGIIVMVGCAANQAWAVAGSRSGRSVTTRRLSRLQMILAYRCAPPGPIINADDFEPVCRCAATAPDHPQQRVVADRQQQAPRNRRKVRRTRAAVKQS